MSHGTCIHGQLCGFFSHLQPDQAVKSTDTTLQRLKNIPCGGVLTHQASVVEHFVCFRRFCNCRLLCRTLLDSHLSCYFEYFLRQMSQGWDYRFKRWEYKQYRFTSTNHLQEGVWSFLNQLTLSSSPTPGDTDPVQQAKGG